MVLDEDQRISAVDMDSPRQISPTDRPTGPPKEVNEVDTESNFEFAFAPKYRTDGGDSPADEIFYPIFGRDFKNDELASLPMEKLVLEGDSAASSESDEPAAESYCVWSPRSPEKYQKRSSSTGSSAVTEQCRWRLRDIIAVGRSRSEGKERFLFVHAHVSDDAARRKDIPTDPKPDSTGKMPAKGFVSAHRAFYGNGKGVKVKRTFLPYRPEFVGVALGPRRRQF